MLNFLGLFALMLGLLLHFLVCLKLSSFSFALFFLSFVLDISLLSHFVLDMDFPNLYVCSFAFVHFSIFSRFFSISLCVRFSVDSSVFQVGCLNG